MNHLMFICAAIQIVFFSISGERHETAIWRFAAEKRHSGELRCKATNRVDSGYNTLNLNVLYRPTVTVQVTIRNSDIKFNKFYAQIL